MTLAHPHPPPMEDVRKAALRPILQPGEFFWPVVIILGVLILWGFVAYGYQIRDGLAVTGLSQRVSWGFYISDLVFFIGVSYGGALTSAILRLTGAPWRAPLTRMAEAMAVVAVIVGGLFPLIDMGRPERMYYLFFHGQIGSPVVWDIVAIGTYLLAGMLFLYLPLIPDIAVCRDRLGAEAGNFRRFLYRRLALNWRGTPEQRRILDWAMTVVAIVIIPLAVSVHSVLAWLFGVTARPGWDSTIFAPYFVLGAMFSGVGVVILVVAAFRKVYHLEQYIEEKHFHYLSYILLALAAGYGYFMFSEYLTEGYKMHETGGALLELLMLGRLAPFFWLFVMGGIVLPVVLIALPQTRNVTGITIAALAVVLGMWLKRFLIVVPGLAEPLMPSELVIYWPSEVEIAVTVAAAASIPLMLMLLFRLFPILSIYEIEEIAAAEAPHGPAQPREEPEA